MELQNVNLTTYCIPFCGAENTTFIPVASEAIILISVYKKTYTTGKKTDILCYDSTGKKV